MMPIEPGDVLLVPFPFTDQTAVKQRTLGRLSAADLAEVRSLFVRILELG